MKLYPRSILLIVAFMSVVPCLAKAATGGLLLDPAKISLDINPGESIQRTVTVTNNTGSKLIISPELKDFTVTQDNKIQWYVADISNPYRTANWLSVSSKNFTLVPGASVVIPFTINIDKNSKAGGRYGTIFFNAKSESGSEIRVGTLVIVNIIGEITKNGSIVSFETPRFVIAGPVNFSLTYKNTGATHYETRADIQVSNLLWQAGTTASDRKFVYPGISRQLDTTWRQALMFGIYTAQASVVDGSGQAHVVRRHFVGISYPILLVIVGLVAGFIYFKRRANHVQI